MCSGNSLGIISFHHYHCHCCPSSSPLTEILFSNPQVVNNYMFLNASVNLIQGKYLDLNPNHPFSQLPVPVIHLLAVNSVLSFLLLTAESSVPQTFLSTSFQLDVTD